MRRKDNRNGQLALVELTCVTCGRTFSVWPYQARDGRKYCSPSCYGRRRPPGRTPEEQIAAQAERQRRPEVRAAQRARYAENPSYYKEKTRDWALRNAEYVRAERANYYARTRDAQSEASKRERAERRAAMIEAYGNACACCGITEPRLLTLDHTYGDGKSERELFGSNDQIIARLQREGWPQNGRYRLLCWNCQFGTRMGECKHQRGD